MTMASTPEPTKTSSTEHKQNQKQKQSNSSATPGRNNNYSAPHTPIASAKRPKIPSSGRRSIGHSTTKLNHISEHVNANEDSSAQVLTPVRKMNLDGTPNRPNHNDPTNVGVGVGVVAAPMSPMHPIKPVTSKNKDHDVAAKDHDPQSSSGSGSGSVLKSIFSPVLNFLNHNKDDAADDVNSPEKANVNGSGTTAPSGNVNASVESNVNANEEPVADCNDNVQAAQTQSHTDRHSDRDPDGDVYMSYDQHANAQDNRHDIQIDQETPKAESEYDHDNDQNSYGQYTSTVPSNEEAGDADADTDTNAAHAYTHVNTAQKEQQQQGQIVTHNEEDEEEDEDEFNPYLFIKYLPQYHTVVPDPSHKICLPSKDPGDPPISLVLDLDETLVHCTVEPIQDADMTFPVLFNGIEYKVHVRIRPFLMDFLEAVSQRFEVVVFTASQEVYANELLDRIDPDKKYIKHRMFRESCLLVEGNYLKDLNVLGRDLKQAVLVDNSPHAFGYQVDNGIPIESWFDDPNDTELLKLEQFCSTLHGVKDVRSMVRSKFQTYKLIRDA